SVPQRQQSLGAEWGSMQLLIRSDGNLAIMDCRGRLAAQRNSVIPDDIDAHEGVLLIDPAVVPPRPHSRSLRRPKPVYSRKCLGVVWRDPSMKLLGRVLDLKQAEIPRSCGSGCRQ